MRLTIHNKTGRPDADVLPYVELAANRSSARGKVELTVYNTRNGRPWGGYCWWSKRPALINVGVPKDPNKVTRREVTTLGYFRQHGIPLRRPYVVNNWQELLVDISAHEFGHLMKRGQGGRKSRKELFCEEQVAIALDFMRTEEGQEFIANRKREIETEERHASLKRLQEKAAKRSPDTKRERLLAAQKRWTTKAKRAATALKKIARQLRRLEKQEAA